MTDNQLSELTPLTIKKDKRKWFNLSMLALLVLTLTLLPLILDSPYTLHILILTFVYIVASVSLRSILISGQFPLAHGAFMGLGAYLSGMASKWMGLSPWLTIPSAALIVAGIGILIGYPFSRLRAFYYAMGSLFFGIGILLIIYAGGRWTGGYSGLMGIRPIFMGSKIPYYYFFLGLTLVCLIAMYRFEFSRIGTNLKAIAQSHEVASSVGINESRYRIMAVGFGCFFVGLIGAAYAHYNLVISPTSFNLSATLWLVMYVLIGGTDNFKGPIIGTAVLLLIPEFFRDLKLYLPYLSAGILLFVVYLFPKGLVSLPDQVRSWYSQRLQKKEANNVS